MAYGGYGDRPYAGPAARAPRGGGGGGGGGAYPPPQQRYEQQEDYGYDGYGGYEQYDDGYGYDPPQPQQDMYRGPPPGRGGRPPPPRGRGGPMRGGPGRGGYPPSGPGRAGYPPPGRGGPSRPGPLERNGSSDPSANRQGPVLSPQERDFGGSAFPSFPGQNRQTDLDHENQILERMGGMNLNGRPPPNRGPGPGPRQFTQDNYSRPSMDSYGRPSMDSQRSGGRGPPPQGYPDSRRGPPPPPQHQGYGGYDEDYGPPMSPVRGDYGPPMSPTRNDFGQPSRSMTMPVNGDYHMSNGAMPPPRGDSANYSAPMNQQLPPQRPSTSSSNRPPPHRTYPDQPPPMPNPSLQPPGWNSEPDRASFGELYDSYYEGQAPLNQPPMQRPGPQQPGAPQPGPARLPELSRTKSQPNLREPQSAVFEMADHPPMPSGPAGGFQAYKPGLPTTPASGRPGNQASPPASGPGSGPPAPIRPGLMPNSLVNMNDKPAPVRNYSNTPPAAAAGAQGRPPPAAAPPPQRSSNPPAPEQPPVTTEELDYLRSVIKDNPNDQASALSLAKKLLEAADVLVPRLPDPKSRARTRERYLVDSHKILKKLASANNADAMFFMADGMGRGAFGHEPDPKEAFTLYMSAAKLQHPAAAYRTAVCCEIGNDEGGGTRKDPLKAIQWYKRAAMLGDPPAMYKVGMILLKGLLGQPKNPREAVGWLKRAADVADAENPHALHELGLLYESAQPNDYIIRDERYALQLFEQASQLGYKFSQYRLGCAYEYGLMGCPIDPRLSIMYYSRAAVQEEHQSELALGGWYLTGSDGILQQSDTEAYLWTRKAANAGLAKAEYGMGYFTEVGIGVPADIEAAKRWYWRAAAQNFPKARERLEDLKKSRQDVPRQRERITRSKVGGRQQEGECSVM
ncbi:hypothetical protein F5Y16DRAFT_145661 [Xylariaceae sp. FL0255]|nr:hypothetical protein F5Y16DRAFT_145661 [Xylariaceae sp. FL0255]